MICFRNNDPVAITLLTAKITPYWWFAYDVIKNMTMQIMINLSYKTIQCVSVPNLNVFKPMKTEFEKLENFLLCYMGKWAGRHSFAYQHGCRNINVWKFSKL